MLVAVWDGKSVRGIGGTREVMDQAERVGIPVVRIHAETGEVTYPDDLAAALGQDPLIDEISRIAKEARIACAGGPATAAQLQACLDELAILGF